MARLIVQETLQAAERKGYKTFIEARNASFQKHKQNLGITYAWPINDPNSKYQDLEFTSIYGDYSYNKEVPSDVEYK